MLLYVLRHAIAVERGAGSDAARALSPKGRKTMRKVARGMKALEIEFDLILSSPFLRARETAEIVAAEWGNERPVEFSGHLRPGRDPAAFIAGLAKRGGRSVLVVGHEPQLSQMISFLLTGQRTLPLRMKKGGLCACSVRFLRHGHRATLEWLLTPSQLAEVR